MAGGAWEERRVPPAVAVADLRNQAFGLPDGEEKVEHTLYPLAHFGRHFPAAVRGQDEEVQIDLHRVALVAGGLLEVDAVCKHLPPARLAEEAGAPPAHPLRPAHPRESDPRAQTGR